MAVSLEETLVEMEDVDQDAGGDEGYLTAIGSQGVGHRSMGKAELSSLVLSMDSTS